MLLAIGAAAAWRLLHPSAAPHYTTVAVTRGEVVRAVTASGSINPEITIQVGTYVSGVIRELYCDYNTRVHQGQLCARIDPGPYQTAVDQDEANLATARAQLAKDQTTLTYAKATLDRTNGLHARGIASDDALDAATSGFGQASSQVAVDEAVVQQHQAELHAAQINLSYTNIVSPVDGTVVSRNITIGQTVAASFQTPTLFLIATDLNRMQVDANVNESDIGSVRVGQAATFAVEAFPGRTFRGDVTQVRQAPQTVQNVVTYDVVITVPNGDLALKPGMTATTRIETARRDDVLRVPDPALRYAPSHAGGRGADANGSRVWILRNGAPVAVSVVTGLDDDSFTEIASGGLRAGDLVIVSEQSAEQAAAGRPTILQP